MILPVILLGAGGHARVVADLLARLDRRVRGAVAKDAQAGTRTDWGLELLGDDDALAGHDPAAVELANGIGSTRDTRLRRTLYERHAAAGYRFPALVHPSAVVADGVELGAGAQVMAGTVIQPGARVGANAIVNTGAQIDHDCRIGDHVHLAPGAVLSGGVTVGAGTHVGTGAVIVQSVTIGAGALIAAGAVVVRDIPEGAVVRPAAAATETQDA